MAVGSNEEFAYRRSSQLAGAKPKAVTTPSGLTESATLNPYTHSDFETFLPKVACPATAPCGKLGPSPLRESK